jgi:adenylylsulfate kinase
MSWAIWITGVPGSGKSAIARAAVAALHAEGERVQHLELDELRRTLTPEPTHDAAEREAVYRALVAVAVALTRAGQPVVIDATAHRRAWRDLARACIADFAEVQLLCPLDVARERERTRPAGHHPRGIYARAGQPGATVPGVDVAYEAAPAPELAIDTTRESVEEAGARVAALARTLGGRAPATIVHAGWAVWISGRPGTGKTTVAAELSARLDARGVTSAVVDAAAFLALVTAGRPPSRLQREVATRAVVAAARRLVDAGLAVLIEGATPVGYADRIARELLERFAHVELVCPTDVCRARERAVRWNLVPRPAAVLPGTEPDLGLDYEPPLRPDLVLFTDVLDPQFTTAEVLRLIDGLERAARQRAAGTTT